MLTQNTLGIASFYCALHILIFLALSVFVVRERLRRRIGLGDGGDMEFLQISRMQGHASEYLSPTLVLLLLFAILDMGLFAVHGFGMATLAGRIMHAAGLHKSPYRSIGRLFGMTLILVSLGVGCFAIILLPLLRG